MPRLKVLFICSRNQWRSPTAERIFSGRRDIEVRSRGLSRTARRKLAATDVAWAELIFVMEEEHRERLVEAHRDVLADKPGPARDIVVLNAGAALYVAGAVVGIDDGVLHARAALASGAAHDKLQEFVAVTRDLAARSSAAG